MSHNDPGQYKGTCQWCGMTVRTRRTGTLYRHKLTSGNFCPGGNSNSAEAEAEERERRATS